MKDHIDPSDYKERPETIVARLAARHYGIFTRAQVSEAGLTESQLKVRLRRGDYERVGACVFRMPGAPETPRQRLLVACWSAGPDAVVSHAAAAWLFGLPNGDPAAQITLPLPARRKLAGVTVHSTSFLPVCDRTMLQAIPATNPARLVIDMAGVLPRRDLEILLDAVLNRDLAKDTRIAWRVSELAVHGRSGVKLVGELLQARSKEGGVPASVLESLARLLLEGLPPHRFNTRVIADKERVVDVDFPGLLLVGEFDGWANHNGRIRYQDDVRRQNAMITQGRAVLRFTYEDVIEHPEQVRAAFIANALRLARERRDVKTQAEWAAADPAVPKAFFAGLKTAR
ncbi:MAG TPA: type IV toxin-antitoxin system AbiEi family antitoxin domain-containing protein [Actinomycetota bacterium]|nr:type IV toxin-antitoxin system AbiEi family antitoxin domain-containing protein [Actinomycetota bacterium]